MHPRITHSAPRALSSSIASTNALVVDGKNNEVYKDAEIKDVKNTKLWSRVCGGGKFVYGSNIDNERGHFAHAESRIIEDFFKEYNRRGVTGEGRARLLFSIEWPKPPGNRSPNHPCQHCEKLMCAAMECVDIQFCVKNQNYREGSEDPSRKYRYEVQTPYCSGKGS